MAREDLDPNTLRWLDDVSTWRVTASELTDRHEANELVKYPYHYFSPYRPMNFIGGQLDHLLLYSTEPNHDFVYTRQPLTTERIRQWQLIPTNEAAWAATGWAEEPPYEP